MTDVPSAIVTPHHPRHAWIDPLACGAIFTLGLIAIDGWPRSFGDAGTRVAISAPAAAIFAALSAAVASRHRFLAAIATVLAIAACVLPTAWPKWQNGQWPAGIFVATTGAIIVTFGLLVLVCKRLRDVTGERLLTLLVLLGMSGATMGLLAFTGSARTMQRTLPLAIVLVLALVAGAIWRNRLASLGVIAFSLAVIAGQLVTGWLWSELALWQAACVAVAPLIARGAVQIPAIARFRRPAVRITLALLVAATPAIVACAVAGARYAQEWQSTATDDAAAYGY